MTFSERELGSFSESENNLTNELQPTNNQINEENMELQPNPFEEDESVVPGGTTSAHLNIPFQLILDEPQEPLYERGYVFTAQFKPTKFSRNKSSQMSESGAASMYNPIVQWMRGGVEKLTVGVRLFSLHSEDMSARDKYFFLIHMSEPSEETGRPPILAFFWGEAYPFGFPCYLESLGEEVYDDIRPDGSIRGITATMTLIRFQQFYPEQEDAATVERTPTHTVTGADTYESIAQRYYGDPMYGVLLRRMNTRKVFDKNAPRLIADLEPGDKVKIYPKKDLQQAGRITPETHVLKSTSNASHVRALTFQTRAKKIGMTPRK